MIQVTLWLHHFLDHSNSTSALFKLSSYEMSSSHICLFVCLFLIFCFLSSSSFCHCCSFLCFLSVLATGWSFSNIFSIIDVFIGLVLELILLIYKTM